MANHLNDFYSNIATNIAKKINVPSAPFPPPDPDSDIPVLHEAEYFNMANRPLQQAAIIKAPNLLQPKRRTDYHSLSMFFIKKIFRVIQRPILHVPNKLKVAKISPIFKNGDKKQVTNYRPISLLSCFSKLLEKIVHIRLSNYLESNNKLSSFQFGFCSGHSTSHPSTLLLNYISHSFNQRKNVAAIFHDCKV